MKERESSTKLIPVLAQIMPYVFLLAGAIGFSCLFVLGRSDLAFKSLYILVPIMLASLVVIMKPGWFRKDSINFSGINLSHQAFLNVVLLFTLLFIASLILLIVNEITPLGYYILMGLMASLVFLQILSCGEENTGRRNTIILEIVLISASLSLGQTLRLPFYFGYGDINAHMYNIDYIVTTNHVDSGMLIDYQYFPGFHIYNAMGNLLSDMDLQLSYFIFNGLFFIISIPLVYLLVSKLTRNIHLPLIAALIYSLSLEVIFYSMYTITRAMAFVMCLVILYLLIRGRENLKIRIGALLLVFPLILIHHTTLVHFSVILLIFVILEFLLYRPKWYVGFNFLLFFVIAYLGYWIWHGTTFFENTVFNYFITPDITWVALPEAGKPLYLTFTNNASNMIIVFLAILGIIVLLRTSRETAILGTIFTLIAVVALVVYSPVISEILNDFLLVQRLQLIVTPFLAFVAAAGLLLITANILNQRKSTMKVSTWPHLKAAIPICIGAFLIFSLAFSSMIIRANSNDLNFPKVLGNESRHYFMDSEISAFSFADKYSGEFSYSGDYASSVYMKSNLGIPVDQFVNIFDPASINQGYFLFRENELKSREQLGFLIWGKDGAADQEYLYQLGDSPDLQTSWEGEDKIYDDGSTYIYKTKAFG